ncbi:MAG: PrsW family intramembrane metalloprotease [Deltaproteobacteria bacterium]|nr:PrsW family intramembrane metalloprotease [Candidatus Zymogenaceae bacterium]
MKHVYLPLLVLAVAPGFFILWYIYIQDRYEPEPKKLIFKVFLWGAASTVPAIIVELLLEKALPVSGTATLLGAFVEAFIIVAPIEELCKMSATYVSTYRSHEFNEVMDGIVYGVAAAIGFATIENIFYVLSMGAGVGVLRALFAVPGHAMWGAIIGFYLGMKKMHPEASHRYILAGFIVAVLFHGVYDFVLFTASPLGFLIVPIIIWLYFVYKKRLRSAQKSSPFRNGRDTSRYENIPDRYSPRGIMKVSAAFVLFLAAVMIAVGAVTYLKDGGVWQARYTVLFLSTTVVPVVVGVILAWSAKKDTLSA